MKVDFRFPFEKKKAGRMRGENCTPEFKIHSLCFQRRKITKTHRLSCYYLLYFGKTGLCTAGSKKEILYVEADCSVLKLMTKVLSLTRFRVSLDLLRLTQLPGFNFPVKIIMLK